MEFGGGNGGVWWQNKNQCLNKILKRTWKRR